MPPASRLQASGFQRMKTESSLKPPVCGNLFTQPQGANTVTQKKESYSFWGSGVPPTLHRSCEGQQIGLGWPNIISGTRDRNGGQVSFCYSPLAGTGRSHSGDMKAPYMCGDLCSALTHMILNPCSTVQDALVSTGEEMRHRNRSSTSSIHPALLTGGEPAISTCFSPITVWRRRTRSHPF